VILRRLEDMGFAEARSRGGTFSLVHVPNQA
jgi:hypothetical protein